MRWFIDRLEKDDKLCTLLSCFFVAYLRVIHFTIDALIADYLFFLALSIDRVIIKTSFESF